MRDPAETLPPANTFRDCDHCPLMLNIAGGTFMMGAPNDELGRKAWEGPVRKVAMAPFAIGVTEVTHDEWDACVADGGCGKYTPASKVDGGGKLPVTQVSWKDAAAYAAWLTKTVRARLSPADGSGVGVCRARWFDNAILVGPDERRDQVRLGTCLATGGRAGGKPARPLRYHRQRA